MSEISKHVEMGTYLEHDRSVVYTRYFEFETVICELFDEALQRHIKVEIPWRSIARFMERRQPLGLKPASLVGVRVAGSTVISYAFERHTWNPERKTHELDGIYVGTSHMLAMKVETYDKDKHTINW